MQVRILLPALALVLCFGAVTDAAGQYSTSLRTGDRVRVTHRPAGLSRAIGRVVAAAEDSVSVEMQSLQHVVPLAAVEVSLGVRANGARGMRSGLLVGLATGIVTGYARSANRVCDNPAGCTPPAWFSITDGVKYAAIGALVGGLVGRRTLRERWVRVAR